MKQTLYLCDMKVPSNKIRDIREYYTKQLNSLYEENEARFLVDSVIAHFIEIPRLELALEMDRRVSESLLLQIHFALKDVLNSCPLQYVLGEAEFCGLTFQVNEDVLIPRPETEELVEKIIEANSARKPNLKVLDVGSGSGCIAISLAKQLSAYIHGIDVSQQAIDIATKNALINDVSVEFNLGNILMPDMLNELPNDFDIIVSNPPYVRQQEKLHMKNNVLDFEPHLALFVEDDDALLFYKAISLYAKNHLKDGGQLWFEINEYLANETKELVNEFMTSVQIIEDYKGQPRFLACIK